MTNNAGRELIACRECGMPVASGEYHPYAACLMFRGCLDSKVVRANLSSVARAQTSGVPEESALIEARKQLINTPELKNFNDGVTLEALHQRERWGNSHDVGKIPADWFWLVGYLAGKALHAQTSGNTEKALHHTISTAAALANWHTSISGEHTAMRPGIDPKEHPILAVAPTTSKSASVPVDRLEALQQYSGDAFGVVNGRWILAPELAELIAEYK